MSYCIWRSMVCCACSLIERLTFNCLLIASIDNQESAIDNCQRSFYQTSGSAQRSPCEPRQAGNGATVATATCVAGKSGVWPLFKDEGGRMKRPSCFVLCALCF